MYAFRRGVARKSVASLASVLFPALQFHGWLIPTSSHEGRCDFPGRAHKVGLSASYTRRDLICLLCPRKWCTHRGPCNQLLPTCWKDKCIRPSWILCSQKKYCGTQVIIFVPVRLDCCVWSFVVRRQQSSGDVPVLKSRCTRTVRWAVRRTPQAANEATYTSYDKDSTHHCMLAWTCIFTRSEHKLTWKWICLCFWNVGTVSCVKSTAHQHTSRTGPATFWQAWYSALLVGKVIGDHRVSNGRLGITFLQYLNVWAIQTPQQMTTCISF